MPKISVMSRQLANLIAAGEVVERPANIVKECVENALDAKADSISIEADEGGIERLVITDNGCGMDYEDAVLAFESHATSKISSEEELFNISTMGFRGEALPSIAAVSRVDLKTAYEGEGSHVVMEYGNCVQKESLSVASGTRIEVSGLFLQTPARLKYLKKPNTEFAQISDLVTRLALSRPDVRFLLKHNGRVVFQSSGNGKMDEIFYQMFGLETARSTRAFKGQDLDFTIEGLLVLPRISRASKKNIFIMVNGRIVRSWQVTNAILEGYSEYLPKERYPIVCLNITCDPQLIDVNVHPNKWEVRLSKEIFLNQLVTSTIANALSDQMQTVEVSGVFEKAGGELSDRMLNDPFGSNPAASADAVASLPSEKPRADQTVEPVQNPLPENHRFYEPASFTVPHVYSSKPKDEIQKTDEPLWKPDPVSQPAVEKPVTVGYPIPKKEPEQPQLDLGLEEDAGGKKELEGLMIIGQLKDSYILCQSDKGLVIIDQHAAQERYHFEQLQKKFLEPVRQVQPMMVPMKIQVDPALSNMVDEVNETYRDFGLHFEAFNGLFLLTAQPAWLADTDGQSFLEDLLSQWMETRKANLLEIRRKAIATMACHSSIRFNRRLNMNEMEQVILDLQKCDQPWHCPHGRPTVITVSDAALRKEFERG